MATWGTKLIQIIPIVKKYWRPCVGSVIFIVSVFMLIFKVITAETLTAVVAALIATGYIPSSKKSKDE